MTDMTPIDSLRAEARALARSEKGLGLCRALDRIARAKGFPNWKQLLRSSSTIQAGNAADVDVGVDAARRANAALNSWIGSAMNRGAAMAADRENSLRRALDPSVTDYGMRSRDVSTALGHAPANDRERRIHDAATHAVATIAHEALVDGDLRMQNRRVGQRPYGIEDVHGAVRLMHTAFRTPDEARRNAEDAGVDTSGWRDSSWTWFDEMAGRADFHLRPDAARAFEAIRDAGREDHAEVVRLVAGLRGLENPTLGAFEAMIAERYVRMSGGSLEEHAESARVNLEAHLADHDVAFGDPSVVWDRGLADSIADADMDVWSDFA